MSTKKSDFLTPAELCQRWRSKVTEGTLANWRSRGSGPAYVKIEGGILYSLPEVEKFEKKNLIKPA